MKQAGETFGLAPGQSFTFEKILSLSRTSHATTEYIYNGTATSADGSKLPGSWEAIVIDGGGKQDVAALSYKNDITLNADITIDWNESHIQITKVDENNNIIQKAGTEFTVYADAALTTVLGTIETDENGVAEGYIAYSEDNTYVYVVETKAPAGYVKNMTPIEVKLSELVKETYQNKEMTGTLKIEKYGKALVDVKVGENGTALTYADCVLEGAVFGLYAKEDIKAAYDGNTVIYKAGTLVTTLTTGTDGMASAAGLLVGNYYLKEISAPVGFVKDTTEYPVEISYDGITDQVIGVELTGESAIYNTRQSVRISLVKNDEAHENVVLAGAKFALYAAEDIVGFGQTKIPKDTMLAVAISGNDGVAKFDIDLPLGVYYVKELTSPIGYILSDEIVVFDATNPQENVEVYELAKEFTNCKVTVKINKTDINGIEKIAGAGIAVKAAEDIYDAEGNLVYKSGDVIDTWISEGGAAKDIGTNLIVGASYILEEISAPTGYAYAQSISFKLLEDGSVEVAKESIDADGTILLKDEAIEFLVNKVDSKDNTKEIAGAELTVLGQDANGAFTVVIDKWVSKVGEVYDFGAKLDAGNEYILRETKVPSGYKCAADIKFKVEKDGAIVTDAKKITDASGRTVYLMEDEAATVDGSVKTGDNTPVMSMTFLMLATAITMMMLVYRKYCRR